MSSVSGTTRYTWDARNRLIAISGPGLSATFSYDALGRRVSKTINGVTTSYLYDGQDIAQEIGGGAVGASYVRSLFIDEPFIRQAAAPEFYHADALGSTLSLTNGAGAVAVNYAYEAFGKTTISGTSSNTFQYTGRENDGTALYYYRARYYNPTFQRFLTEDSRGIHQPTLNGCNIDRIALVALTTGLTSQTSVLSGLSPGEILDILRTPVVPREEVNLYNFANDDPVNTLDPSGLQGGKGKFIRCLGLYIADLAICARQQLKKPDDAQFIKCTRRALLNFRACLRSIQRPFPDPREPGRKPPRTPLD